MCLKLLLHKCEIKDTLKNEQVFPSIIRHLQTFKDDNFPRNLTYSADKVDVLSMNPQTSRTETNITAPHDMFKASMPTSSQ